MTLGVVTIGRFTAAGIEQWDEDDQGVASAAGWVGPDDAAADPQASAEANARLLIDHARSGAPVPVSWDHRPGVAGLYFVTDAQIAAVPSNDEDLWRWSCTLTRGGQWAEVVVDAALRSNAHSVTSGEHFVAVPGLGGYLADGWGASIGTRNTANGGVVLITGSDGQYRPAWVPSSPTEWLLGSPTVAYRGYPAAGPRSLDGDLDASTDWEVSNGLVTVTPELSGSDWGFRVTSYTAGGDATATDLIFLGYTTGGVFRPLVLPGSMRVLQCDMQTAVVRWGVTASDGAFFFVNLTVRRGDRWARFVIETSNGSDVTLSLKGPAAFSTDTTGLVHEGSGTHRLCAATSVAYTRADSNTRLDTTSAVALVDFGVGHALDHASAVAPDRDEDLKAQYFSAVTESVGAVDP